MPDYPKHMVGPRRLLIRPEFKSKRWRITIKPAFLDDVSFLGPNVRVDAEQKQVVCWAIPNSPFTNFQLVPRELAPELDVSDIDNLEEFRPDTTEADGLSVLAAKWAAEQLSPGGMSIPIAATPSGYKVDIKRWLRIALDLDPSASSLRSSVVLFVVGDVIQIYSARMWYETLGRIRQSLEDVEERSEILAEFEG